MPDAGWKQFERRIAEVFGGQRRGADYVRQGAGTNDIVHKNWSIECKLYGRPNYQMILDAAKQAEAASDHELQCPIAVVKRKRDHDRNALVVMRLEVFDQWFVGAKVDDARDDDGSSTSREEEESTPLQKTGIGPERGS